MWTTTGPRLAHQAAKPRSDENMGQFLSSVKWLLQISTMNDNDEHPRRNKPW